MPLFKKTKKKRKVGRSAKSGKFVNKKSVLENPSETVTELVKKNKKTNIA